jgi:hypothetical protein
MTMGPAPMIRMDFRSVRLGIGYSRGKAVAPMRARPVINMQVKPPV